MAERLVYTEEAAGSSPAPSTMIKRVDCKITGRVQLVLFRDSSRRQAVKLRLTGFVKNERDGSVHTIAEGEEENLFKFVEYLKKGPPLARVDSVEVKWGESTNEFSKFKIEY